MLFAMQYVNSFNHKCALAYITNCSITPVASDVAQLTVFLDYIEKSANRECPGGLFGCANGKFDNKPRCIDRISFFLEKNALTNQTITTQTSLLTLFDIFLILLIDYWRKISSYSLVSFI